MFGASAVVSRHIRLQPSMQSLSAITIITIVPLSQAGYLLPVESNTHINVHTKWDTSH